MFNRYLITLILLVTMGISLVAQTRPRTLPMSFDNPGNRRILRTEAGNYYYYRSLPERSMSLNTKGINEITIRSFAIEPLRKPQLITIIGKKRTTIDLALAERLNGYYIYKPVNVTIPEGTESIELLCYDRSIYFRSFYTVVPVPKPKVVRIPNMQIKEHGGIMNMAHNGKNSEYHSFNPDQSLKFELNNARNAVVYVRTRLVDRSLPSFALYHNGERVEEYEFTLKRTTKYKIPGIRHLSVAMKVELPKNTGTSTYELRAISDHLFVARPVLIRD